MRSCAPRATSPPLPVSLAGEQPPATFLRSSAVYRRDGLPALLHAGTTWGSERAWYVTKERSIPKSPIGAEPKGPLIAQVPSSEAHCESERPRWATRKRTIATASAAVSSPPAPFPISPKRARSRASADAITSSQELPRQRPRDGVHRCASVATSPPKCRATRPERRASEEPIASSSKACPPEAPRG